MVSDIPFMLEGLGLENGPDGLTLARAGSSAHSIVQTRLPPLTHVVFSGRIARVSRVGRMSRIARMMKFVLIARSAAWFFVSRRAKLLCSLLTFVRCCA